MPREALGLLAPVSSTPGLDRPNLLQTREIELGAFADAGRPAGGDGFEPRVEAHALGAVDRVIAEQRALPAADIEVRKIVLDERLPAHARPTLMPIKLPSTRRYQSCYVHLRRCIAAIQIIEARSVRIGSGAALDHIAEATSVKAGTVFTRTLPALTKWFQAIFLITQSKNSISTLELSRQIGVKWDSAWLMRQKLASVMAEREASKKLDGRIEMDDAVLGGEKCELDGGKRGRRAESARLRHEVGPTRSLS